ncbi:MAG: hypothetical protein JWR16_3610 [Nevskia sp.]|nr:hypothetical protein [Nevskia sp.]
MENLKKLATMETKSFKLGAFAAATALMSALACAPASASTAAATQPFSQSLVLMGAPGDGVCESGSRWSTEDLDCHASERAPTPAEDSIVVTAPGRAISSLAITRDGFGSGTPVLALKAGVCPANVQVDGGQQQIGAEAQYLITSADGSASRTVTAVLAAPQSAQFLRNSNGRVVFALPALDQALSSPMPVDLGPVKPGDRIELKVLAVGTTTSCDHGVVRQQALQANLWGQSSTETAGYLGTAMRTASWDDTKIVPFKVVANFSY